MASITDPEKSPYTVLSIERDGHVATLFLDRPEKRNAMGMPFFAELPEAMADLGKDREIRAIVVAAKGPHFSVGLDLNALADVGDVGSGPDGAPSAAEIGRRTHGDVLRLQAAISAPAECPKPVIAAVHGYCIGGGVDLITSCDIRVCSADAVFSVRETKMAIVADIGSLARLPLVLSMGQVAELVYTGKDIDAYHGARSASSIMCSTTRKQCSRARGRSPRRSRRTRPSRWKARKRCSRRCIALRSTRPNASSQRGMPANCARTT